MSALVFEMFPEDCEIDSAPFKTPPQNKKRRQFVAFKRKFGKGKKNAGCDQPHEDPTTISDFNSVFSPHLAGTDEQQPNDDYKDSKSCSIGSGAIDRDFETRVIYDLTHDSPSSAHDDSFFQQDAATDDGAGMLKRSDSIETLVMTIADETLEEDSLFYPVDEAEEHEAKEDDNNEVIHITKEVETWKRVCRSRSPMFGSPNNTNKTVSYCSSPSY